MYGPTCHGGRHAVGGSSGRMDSSPTCSCAPLNTTRGACWYVGTRRVGVHVLLVLYAEDGGPHRRSATASAIDASPVCMYGRPVELLSVGQRHLASTSSHPHASCMRAPTRSSTCHLLAWSLGRRHQQCLERARLRGIGMVRVGPSHEKYHTRATRPPRPAGPPRTATRRTLVDLAHARTSRIDEGYTLTRTRVGSTEHTSHTHTLTSGRGCARRC